MAGYCAHLFTDKLTDRRAGKKEEDDTADTTSGAGCSLLVLNAIFSRQYVVRTYVIVCAVKLVVGCAATTSLCLSSVGSRRGFKKVKKVTGQIFYFATNAMPKLMSRRRVDWASFSYRISSGVLHAVPGAYATRLQATTFLCTGRRRRRRKCFE